MKTWHLATALALQSAATVFAQAPVASAPAAPSSMPQLTESQTAMRELARYCTVRESTTELIVNGRDNGVDKAQIIKQLPTLAAKANDAQSAAFYRVEDVYSMPRLNAKTLTAHRFFSCLRQGVKGVRPVYDKDLEGALFLCQTEGGTADRQFKCVQDAQRKFLLK